MSRRAAEHAENTHKIINDKIIMHQNDFSRQLLMVDGRWSMVNGPGVLGNELVVSATVLMVDRKDEI
jgi:hypothetical protein